MKTLEPMTSLSWLSIVCFYTKLTIFMPSNLYF